MIGPVVLLTARYLNNHFCPTDCLSGIQVMLIHTSVKPEMPRARAATCDKSIILPLMNGPRSVILTTVERPLF
jgi:hypothetical protein